ncbi:MAG: hypothetical protein ACPL4E_04305 [Thermoproteota archaeon]
MGIIINISIRSGRIRTSSSKPSCQRKPPSRKAGTERTSKTPVMPNHLPLFYIGTTSPNIVMNGMKIDEPA